LWGAAIWMIARAFAVDLKTGGLVWSYTDERGLVAFRFVCRRS
jgi:hypothetical protein